MDHLPEGVSLERLAAACDAAHMPFPPLPPERFDATHEAFERSSSQQGEIRSELRRLIAQSHRPGETTRVLSVGPGNGMLDLPLLEELARAGVPVDYVGVDPNRVAVDRFRDGFAELAPPGVSLHLNACGVEELGDVGSFDLIHAVHSLYYLPDPAGALSRLLGMLRPGGRLVVFHAPRGALNTLAECFWSGDEGGSVWFSDRVASWLEETDRRFERVRIDGQLDVSRALDAGDDAGRLVLDFVLHTPSDALDESLRAQAVECLRSISERKSTRWLTPHPVDAFVVLAS